MRMLDSFDRELSAQVKDIFKGNSKLSAESGLFDLLIENIEDLVWIMNSDFKIVFASPSVLNLLGYTQEEFLKITIFDICTDESVQLFKEATENRIKGKSDDTKKHWDITVKNKSGSILWLDTLTTPIIDPKEGFIGTIGVSRDITERKKIEQENKEIQANLLAQIENTDDFIWSINKNYEISIINKAFRNEFYKSFGVYLEPGSNIIEALPEPLKPIWITRYNKALAGDRFREVDHFEIIDQIIYVETTFNPLIIEGTIAGVSCFSREITEQKQVERALKDSEKSIKDFVSNIPSVSYQCLVDEHWTMKFISDEIYNLLGYPPGDFIDNEKRSYASVIHESDKVMVDNEVNRQLSTGKEGFELQYRVVDKNRRIKWVQEWGRARYDDDGKIVAIDGVIIDITEKKITEQKLIENEDKFKSLSEASVEMMHLKNQNEVLEYIAKTMAEKHPETTVLSTSFDKCNLEIVAVKGVHAKGFNNFSSEANVLLDKNDPKLIDSLKKGQLIRVKDVNKLISDENNLGFLKHISPKLLKVRNLYVVGIAHNDTILGSLWILSSKNKSISNSSFINSFINLSGLVLNQKGLLSALHTSQETLSKIFNHSNSAIAIQTVDKIYLVNKAWEQITGYTKEDAETLHPSKLIHPQDRERIIEMAQKRIEGEEVPNNYLFHLIDKKGQEKWLDLSASIIDHEGKKATLVVASDITQRKNDELELIKLSTGIMNSPSSIVITDIEGNVEYVNPYFSQFTGYTFDEVKGKNPRMWKSGNTPFETYRELWSTILSGNVWRGEIENRKKNGELYWESATIAPIVDNDGIVISFIGIKIDITEQINTLGQLAHSEKQLQELNAKKDKFFSIIAHDLRSPFSALVGLTGILKKNIRQLSDDEIDNYLELLNQSSQNVFKLLENLLTWAKTQTGRIEFSPISINMHDLVQETVDIIKLSAKSKEIQIVNKTPFDIRANGDKDMLLTVFRNLISNALKYSHRQGLIEIGCEKEHFNGTVEVKFWVKDNGVGIPKNSLNKIFKIEENYTTKGTEKEKGSGLGLILCKDFIELHKGNIWVESEEGMGSTFFFTIPE